MIDQIMVHLFQQCLSCLTDAVTVCKAKDAFDLVECHMLLDLYHIPVELRRGTVENTLKLRQNSQNNSGH